MVSATPAADARHGPAPIWPLACLALYFALIGWQASLLAPSGRSDDLETLLLSQSLAWGYEAKNPPAFYWLAHLVTGALGPSLPVIYGLRMAGVLLMYAGLYALARRLQPDPLLAGCAGFAMLATLHFHWYVLFYLTNTALAMALAPLAVLGLFRIADRPTAGRYLHFGLVVGLGLLSRYNFAIFALALIAAGLTLPAWRARLVTPKALLAAAVVLLLLGPHVLWMLRHAAVLSEQVGNQLVGDAVPYGRRVVEGLGNLAEASVSILIFPLGLLALACFPGAFRRVPVADPARAEGIALVGRTVLIALGLMLVYVLAGSSYVKPHHLFFLMLAPLWLIVRLDPATLRPWAPRAFAAGLAACALAAAVAYPFDHRREAAECDACEEFQPVERFAGALSDAGFRGGTILALSRRQDFPTAALLQFFPEARLVAVDYPVYAPPAGERPGACLLVWRGPGALPPGMDEGGPVPGIGLPLPPTARTGFVQGRIHISGRPGNGMRFALVPEGLGSCR